MKTNIGIFDSGIGGVTVLRECLNMCPNFNYIYYSDSKNNPYGDKDEDELINIVDKIVTFLIDRNCFVIIIACNTASSICVKYLREKYLDIKFIAIEPAIKLAFDNDILGNTLVMATKGTMDSLKFRENLKKYDSKSYYLCKCVGLANIIECDDNVELKKYLKKTLSFYKDKVNSIVLGCTHYPLIKKEISSLLGDVTFYDGAIGVSKQLFRIIKINNYIGNDKKILFIDSTGNKLKKKRFRKILEE